MKTENERIGFNLRAKVLRYMAKNTGVIQSDIAIKAGVHPVTLSRILNGEGTTLQTIEKICSVVGGNASRIIEKGRRANKYSIKTLEDVLNDNRKLSQFIGTTNRQELSYARGEIWAMQSELEKYRRGLQRDLAYSR